MCSGPIHSSLVARVHEKKKKGTGQLLRGPKPYLPPRQNEGQAPERPCPHTYVTTTCLISALYHEDSTLPRHAQG